MTSQVIRRLSIAVELVGAFNQILVKYVFNLRILYIVLIISPLLFTDILTCVLLEVSASGLSDESYPFVVCLECDCEPSTEEAVAD